MFNAVRVDRTFDNFLEIQEKDGLSSNSAELKGLKKLRANRRARRQAADDAYEMYEDQKERGEFQGTFLDFLIANKDQILALILSLIKLFSL